jgi:DNA-binding transcriptional MerR regulator
MNPNEQPLKTMKEIAERLGRPAHRIIHLCETGVVEPAEDAAGRGSVRRFRRDDIFRILVALELQEAGVQVPLIKPLMRALDYLHGNYAIQEREGKTFCRDLVGVIKSVSSREKPVRAFLRPPREVALVVPDFKPKLLDGGPGVAVRLYADDTKTLDWKVSIAVNLTLIAREF